MKAITYNKYGSPDELKLEEVAKPIPKDNEVLIKVRAASINSWDWDLLRGEPFIVRLAGGGIKKPIKKILGCDVAGQVETVGNKVKNIKVGDAVFGDISQSGWGAFAEYVCAPETALMPKPIGMTFEEAAALPQAGVMALQGIQDYGRVTNGQKVLINGAGGGVGTFAIQLAKMYGAEVTAVDHTNKLDKMQSLGTDYVIDYTQEDFTNSGKQYDFILDVVGHHSLFDYKRSLRANGMYRMVGGNTKLIFQSLLIGPMISVFGSKKMGILAHEPNKGLDTLLALCESGKVEPIIDKVYELFEVPAALQRLGDGMAFGKVVIRM